MWLKIDFLVLLVLGLLLGFAFVYVIQVHPNTYTTTHKTIFSIENSSNK